MLDFLSSVDPTKVRKADDTAVKTAIGGVQQATQAGQDIIKQRMAETKAPELEKVKGPQAGQIDTGFLQALRGQLPSGQAAVERMGAMGAPAQAQAAEATGLLREAALGGAPSAAQLQQKQAFEQAIAAQMAAQAGRGFDPAAMRQAQVGAQQLMGQQAQQAGILAAQEQQAARQAYAQAAQSGAGLGLQQQELQLRAAQGDVNAQLQLAQIQAGLAGQQAQLQTQTGIAGAEIAARQAGQQAELQAQAQQQLNALANMYMQAGMTGAQAQLAAEQALFGVEAQRQQQISQARAGVFGGVLSGLSAAAEAGIGKGAMAPAGVPASS